MEGHVECAGEEALVDSVATAGVGRGVTISVVTAEDDEVDEGDIGSR